MSEVYEPQVVEFGPYRAIGISYIGKNEHGEIPHLWHEEGGFLSRMHEVQAPAGAPICVGILRCVPGVTDGSFEYIAAALATADAPIPDGMVEAEIAAASYLVLPVPSLAELMNVWGSVGNWMAAHPEWQAYCDGMGICNCATHPSFELYPAEFPQDGKLFIYLPVRGK